MNLFSSQKFFKIFVELILRFYIQKKLATENINIIRNENNLKILAKINFKSNI